MYYTRLYLHYLLITFLQNLPNNKMSDLSKFKAFTDDNLNMANMTKSVCDRAENIEEKGKNAITSIFFFSQKVFKKHFPSKGC